jgi:hypothetical protein
VKISIVRGGGLAGVVTATTLNVADLSEQDAAMLHDRVNQAELLSLPEHSQSAPPQPDSFYYELTVEDKHRRHTVRLGEQDLSPQLRELITWVYAAPARRQEVVHPGQRDRH